MTQVIEISIDLARPGVLPRVYAMQGEKNSRGILFHLLNNGQAWDPGEDCGVMVHFRRADGSGDSYNKAEDSTTAVSQAGSQIAVYLIGAVCERAGPVALTVELTKDDTVLATWPLQVKVVANPGCQPVVPGNHSAGGSMGYYDVDLTGPGNLEVTAGQLTAMDVTSEISLQELTEVLRKGQVPRVRIARPGSARWYPLDILDADAAMGDFADFTLVLCSDDQGGVTLQCSAYRTDHVFSVNGQKADPTGNVDVQAKAEQPVSMDLSGYAAGSIRLTYADGGIMDVSVGFDADGNPVRFTNGTEEFTVTWPAEEVAADGEGE